MQRQIWKGDYDTLAEKKKKKKKLGSCFKAPGLDPPVEVLAPNPKKKGKGKGKEKGSGGAAGSEQAAPSQQ